MTLASDSSSSGLNLKTLRYILLLLFFFVKNTKYCLSPGDGAYF